jgi:hypothetical protein
MRRERIRGRGGCWLMMALGNRSNTRLRLFPKRRVLRMAPSAWPDFWSLARNERESVDSRAELLRIHAELFAHAPARDRDTIRAFEAIALGFLPRIDHKTLTAIARLVAPCPDTPDTILADLIQRSPETRSIVLQEAPVLPPSVVSLLLGLPGSAALLARRADLESRTVERLLTLHDDAVDEALAANSSIALASPVLAILRRRAQQRPLVARALLARGDLTLADEASLYLFAGEERRAHVRHRVAASALFQRPHLPFRLSDKRVEALLSTALLGDVEAFEAQLTAAFRLPLSTGWRLLGQGRSELLALALRALGVEEEDATRIFLTLHPSLSHSVKIVFSLVRIARTTARPTALALVEAILGESISIERSGRHQPLLDASGTPARIAPQVERRLLDERLRHAG